MFRMDIHIFQDLCNDLKMLYLLEEDIGIVSVEEVVGMLLYIVGHNKNMRLAANRFQHSLETIQQRFYRALRAIHSLRFMIIRPDYGANEHPGHFCENGMYYPWFKV